MIFHLFSDKIW